MRNLIWIALLLVTPLQGQVIQWSNPEKFNSSVLYSKVLGENEHGVYVLRYTTRFFKQQIIVDRYHHHLKLDISHTLDLKRSRLVKVKLMEKGILVVQSKYDRSRRANELLAYYLDHDLKPLSDPVFLTRAPVQAYADRGDFHVRVSDHERRIAVVTVLRSGEGVEMSMELFDASLKRLSGHSEKMDVEHRRFELTEFMVDEEDGIYALVQQRLKSSRDGPEYYDHFIACQGDSTFRHTFEDSLEYRNLDLSYQRDLGHVLVAGFYGDMAQYGSKGACLYRYITDQRTGELTYAPFSEELADDLSISRNKLDVIPEGFEFLKLIPRTDGGMLCVAEQKDIETENEVVMLHGIPTSTSKNIYNYNDILVMNLDSTGQIEWTEVIHKNQTTVNDGGYFSSAIVFVNQDFIQLIYNDQIRSSGEVMQHTIYSNGESVSRKLLKSAVDYVVVIPVESTQVSSNKLILSSLKNRRFSLFKLIYN